jgi:tripartite-type tricarboxylate transporter receptor subunit TctC
MASSRNEPRSHRITATSQLEPLATQPEEWEAYLKAELARYTKIIRDANIKPE